MALVSDGDVRKALVDVDATGTAGTAPLLRPEQVDRILALRAETDPEVRAAKTIALVEEILREAEAVAGRFEAVRREMGIDKGLARRFLTGGRLSDDAKRQVGDSLARYQQDTLREIETEARRALSQGRTGGRPPRPGRISV